MTLAKACHASNVMQDLKSNLWAYCNHGSFVHCDVSIFHCCIWKKLNLILLNEQIWHLFHIVLLRVSSATFLPNII